MGTGGTGNGQFNGLYGVPIDPTTDYIYVTDVNNSRVQKFGGRGHPFTDVPGLVLFAGASCDVEACSGR
jgi:DNA-binding beta-propeller fold protein YncE